MLLFTKQIQKLQIVIFHFWNLFVKNSNVGIPGLDKHTNRYRAAHADVNWISMFNSTWILMHEYNMITHYINVMFCIISECKKIVCYRHASPCPYQNRHPLNHLNPNPKVQQIWKTKINWYSFYNLYWIMQFFWIVLTVIEF